MPCARIAAPEVGAHAGAQRLRLADVQDVVRGSAEQVDAGLGGKRPQLRLDPVLSRLRR